MLPAKRERSVSLVPIEDGPSEWLSRRFGRALMKIEARRLVVGTGALVGLSMMLSLLRQLLVGPLAPVLDVFVSVSSTFLLMIVGWVILGPVVVRGKRRRLAKQGLQQCTWSGPAAKDRRLDALEVLVSSPNIFPESERMEYAGRLAARLIEAGEIKRAYRVLVDAESVLEEVRRQIIRHRWMPEFRSEASELALLRSHHRSVDPRLGLTGEFMIRLFHRLGTERIDDRILGPAAPLDRLLELKSQASMPTREGRLHDVVAIVTQTFEQGIDVAELWTKHGKRLLAEAKSDLAPTLSLLGIAQASRFDDRAREAWRKLQNRGHREMMEQRLAVVRALCPEAFGGREDVFR